MRGVRLLSNRILHAMVTTTHRKWVTRSLREWAEGRTGRMYRYNPLSEKPVWDGWLFLKTHYDIIEYLARVMISMKSFEKEIPMYPWSSPASFDESVAIHRLRDSDELASTLIWQIRAGARSYYNHWMLRHMLRVMVKIIFGIDPLLGSAIHYANKLEQPIEWR